MVHLPNGACFCRVSDVHWMCKSTVVILVMTWTPAEYVYTVRTGWQDFAVMLAASSAGVATDRCPRSNSPTPPPPPLHVKIIQQNCVVLT